MDIELHLQVWKELREHFTGNDSTEAAEDFIRVLIEHGADANEIAEYALDEHVKHALLEYTDIEVDDEDFDDEFDMEYDE